MTQTVHLYEPQWPADTEPPPPMRRQSNPRLASPMQQIATILPAGAQAQYRFRCAGWVPAWREGMPRLLWPLVARSLDIMQTPGVARPIQVFPVGIRARFRFRFKDGKDGEWRRAEEGRMSWPPFAIGIDIEPIMEAA